ncbi:hypothetical protein U1Q18_039352 [Sarracenia purpurea var. burkii]
MLQSAGHNVTALDMAACGINLEPIEKVCSFYNYSKPLLEFLENYPPDQKVILVGHSLGGLNLAYAMEYYPHKIIAAFFVTAYMTDTTHMRSYVIEKSLSGPFPDTRNKTICSPGDQEVAYYFGPAFLKESLYTLSPESDLELELLLERYDSLYLNDLSNKTKPFTQERYGSVPRCFITSQNDSAINITYQKFMIANYPPQPVLQVNNSDHMVMLSQPRNLTNAILQCASYYCSNTTTS